MAGPWEQYQSAPAADGPWAAFRPADKQPDPFAFDPMRDMTRTQRVLAGAGKAFNDLGQGAGQMLPDEETGGVAQHARNLVAGAVRGAGSIGATLMTPIDAAARAMGVQNSYVGRTDRRETMDSTLQDLGADPSSWMYKGGKLGAEIAGTAGAGGLLARPLTALAARPLAAGVEPLLRGGAAALESGGFRVGELAGTGLALPARLLGGAAAGGAAAGLVDPSQAALGAGIGAATPAAVQAAGSVGRAIGRGFSGGGMAPETAALAQRAQDLGIPIPADRLVNSRPLNALAASLEYVPLSGRTGSVERMNTELNRAVSRTVGQDSPNITQALRTAEKTLGGEFDRVLRSNTVNVDQQFLTDLADAGTSAARDLGQEGQRVIDNQISEIVRKGANGQLDGQAAYNIKRTLDTISKRSTPEAHHAGELRGALMDALNRSIGPDEAAQFAATRQQYGNMMTLRRLAPNGAEGEISAAKLANMRDIRNPQLRELADISAQFVRPREGAHGAAQRVAMGLMGGAATGATMGVPALVGGVAAGRGANAFLNSGAARGLLSNLPPDPNAARGLLSYGAQYALPLSGGLLSGP